MEDIIEVATRQNFVPVLDDFGSFIGIITRKDIFNYMVKRMNQKQSMHESSQDVRHKID
jgi:CBS domain containing-hemolysin-like protein